MPQKVLIVSLKYHPGHYSHLIAYYSLLQDLGYDSYLLINNKFADLDKESAYNKLYNMPISNYKKFYLVIFLFPSLKNILEIIKFKIFSSSKIIYLFHEPINSYNEFYKTGFNTFQIIILFFIDIINKITIFLSDKLILPSKTALSVYKKKYNLWNNKTLLIPLLFDDESNLDNNDIKIKVYISYIGTVATDHAFDKFCDYVEFALANNLFKNFKFLIATGSKLDLVTKTKLLNINHSDRLLIVEGKWLSNQEINNYYDKSLLIWNSYDRSTQSGVLPKSFMFSTPVLGNNLIPNEYIVHKKNGFYLNDNSDFAEITDAIKYISKNIEDLSMCSRNTFLKFFYYKSFKNKFKKLINHE